MTIDSPGWSVPPPTPPGHVCVLCGEDSPKVAHALILWRSGKPFGSGPRCPDREACWARVMDAGEEWLLADGRPRYATPGTDHASIMHPSVEPDAEDMPADIPDALDFGEAPEAEGVTDA